MVENGFYILDKSYRDLVKLLNGEFEEQKSRPVFCCMQDKNIKGLYWLIPTSDLSHRTPEQIQKYLNYSQVKDIRQAYYYVGHTTRPALFKISKVMPASDKYISHEYLMQGTHLIMQDKKQISEITQRLQRILAYEALHPNKLEQKITAVKEFICKEIQQEQEIKTSLAHCDSILVENSKLRAELNAATQEYYRENNLTPLDSSASVEEILDMRRKVLEANPKLMEEFTMAEKKFNQKNNQTQQQSNPKSKHRR